MNYLNKITADAYQQFFLTGISGETITLNLRYLPTQQLWSASITAGNFTVNGLLLVYSPNILRQFRNVIDFGLAVLTVDNENPVYPDDFLTQRAALYLLDADDVASIEDKYFS